jgi:hypothetical protein
MEPINPLAVQAVEELLEYEPDQLFAELEIRRRAILDDPALAGSFAPAGTHRSVVSDSLDDLREFGRRFFDRVSRDAHALVCGKDPENAQVRQDLFKALTSRTTFAAALSAALVAYLGLAPALAAVAATLVARLFVNNAHEVMCEMWTERLQNG